MKDLRKLIRPGEYGSVGLFMAAAALFFFWEPLFVWPAERFAGGNEIGTMFIPWLSFIFDTLRTHGSLPLWNPHLFAGVPFAANPQPMMFYPFTYLGLLMPIGRALALTLALHVWLGGMGMYGWLRAVGATRAGAWLAGAAFAFSGEFVLRVGVGHYGLALQLAWWPLSFWAMRVAVMRQSWRRAILAGLPLALALLSGHTATCLLLYVALGLYTLFEAAVACRQAGDWQAGARVLGWAGLAVAVSVGLAAVQYLPLLTFSQLSVRTASPSLDFSSRFSLPIGHLVTLLVPNFFGEVIRTGTWSVEGYEETTYYVGVLIVALALVGAWSIRRHRLLFFLVLALGAVLLQMGPDGVLFIFFYRFVPGFAWTRAPGRAGLIYAFGMITAAGLVWSELERAPRQTVQPLLRLFDERMIWVVSTLTAGLSLLAFVLYASFKSVDTAWPWHLGGQLTRFLVLFWAAMAVFAAWRNQAVSARLLGGLAVALVLFDLWSYGLVSLRPGPDSLASGWPQLAGALKNKSNYRVAPHDFQFFELNGALAYRLRSHYGYDPLVLARYQKLLDSTGDYADRVYDLLNVKYVAARGPLSQAESGQFSLALDTPELKLYRRSGALARAFIVHQAQVVPDDQAGLEALHGPDFDPGQTAILPAAAPCALQAGEPVTETARVVSESPNHIEVAVQAARAGLLVLSEADYPGWQARLDGRLVPVLRANVALRAVCLPAGAHTVRFDFWPRDLQAGLVLSGLALGVVLWAAMGELWRRP